MKMATPETLKKEILSASLDERLKKAYVTEENVKAQYDRYINLLNEFEALFGKDRDVRLFSAPAEPKSAETTPTTTTAECLRRELTLTQ